MSLARIIGMAARRSVAWRGSTACTPLGALDLTNHDWSVACVQILRAGLEDMTSSVQMFPSTMKVDLFVTAFGLLAPEGQLIRTGGHMHHSRSAKALLGMLTYPQVFLSPVSIVLKPQAECLYAETVNTGLLPSFLS